MGLSQDDIKRLLAKPEKTTTSKGKKLDLSVRTIETWFEANHVLFDAAEQAPTRCSNPECPNPKRMCIEVSGKWTCRVCFLNGYLLKINV